MLRKFLPVVFLSFFIFLFLISTVTCQFESSEITAASPPNTIALFVPETQIQKNGDSAKKKFRSFTSPSLNYVDGVFVVFAQAKNFDNPKNCDIVESLFDFKKDDFGKEFNKATAESKWTKRIITKNDKNICTGSPTAVVNNQNIFVFFKNFSDTEGNKLEYGTIDGKAEVKNANKDITWNYPFTDLTAGIKLISSDLKNSFSVAGGGSGIVTKTKLVIPVMYENSTGVFSTTMISLTDSKSENWEIVPSTLPKNCAFPAVVEWDNKLIMMISCSDGNRKMYESANMGSTWTEIAGFFLGVWGNTKNPTGNEYGGQSGFITADVGD